MSNFSLASTNSTGNPKLLAWVGNEAPSEITLFEKYDTIRRHAAELRAAFREYLRNPNSDEAVRKFAEQSYAIFQKICYRAKWRDRQLFPELKSLFNLDYLLEVKLTGAIAAFPFELLYVREPELPILAEFFLGFRVKVRKSGMQSTKRIEWLAKKYSIQLGKDCALGFARHTGLQHSGPELAELRTHADKKLIRLQEFSTPATKPIQVIASWMKEQFHMVHFACHVRGGNGTPHRMEFHDGELSVDHFKQEDKVLDRAPFVFINACQSGAMDITNGDDLAQIIGDRYAVGLLVTESDIPDHFALDFARVFYNRLFVGASVGDTLAQVKMEFSNTSYRFSGLAYSLFSTVEIATLQPNPHE